MKKISLLIAMLLFATTGAALAADVTPTDSDAGKSVLGDGKAIGKLSASVRLGAKHDTSSYSITTSHIKGGKTFGTSSNATNIYAKDGLDTGVPGASDSSAFATGWTAM